MNKINWRVRFNKKNIVFILRFLFSLFTPILIYFGMSVEDLTTWKSLGQVLLDALNNPYVIGFTLANALNVLPDPTTNGFNDSEQAMTYIEPKRH